jgi:hypothetical protein
MTRNHAAGGIAGLCFLACAVLPLLAVASSKLRVYAPMWREALHATLTPQFAAGMAFMLVIVFVGAFLIAIGGRHE